MSVKEQSPWASGPGEILEHGLSLLKDDSDRNRRLAMISIDNSVELMIKTYLGLPRRVSGLAISRKRLAEIQESYPAMLDALEEYAGDKLEGVNLGEIEWYHRLRNELYHQGNGLTVEIEKVRVYGELARVLFSNLFGFELEIGQQVEADEPSLGAFIEKWAIVERDLRHLANPERLQGRLVTSSVEATKALVKIGTISQATGESLLRLLRIRNELLHGMAGSERFLTTSVMVDLNRVVEELRRLLAKEG